MTFSDRYTRPFSVIDVRFLGLPRPGHDINLTLIVNIYYFDPYFRHVKLKRKDF